MLADQIRDWRIALGAFRDLPLVGTPSTAGGVSLGPVYYWLLWLSRVPSPTTCRTLDLSVWPWCRG